MKVINAYLTSLLSCCASAYCQHEAKAPGNTLAIAYDSFRGISDGSWPGNTGALARYQLAWPVSSTAACMYGLQLGASFGVYNWSGQARPFSCYSQRPMYQSFISAGAYRSTPEAWSTEFGATYDAMLAHNFGIFGLNPKLGQLRAQINVNLCDGHALGLWTTCALGFAQTCHKAQSIDFKAINQINGLYRYRWNHCCELAVWAGVPYSKSLWLCGQRPGKYIFGFKIAAALSDNFVLEGYGSYMGPTGPQNLSGQANVCISLSYQFGGSPYKSKPYLDMANNSNFLVDSSTTI